MEHASSPASVARPLYALRGLLLAASFLASSIAARGVAQPPSQADVIRFLEQATFGPTPALVAHVQAVGFEAFFQEQIAAPASGYSGLPEQPQSAKVGCPAGSPATCLRDNYSMYPLQVRFFLNALSGEDQLRQRVALALHEILVVSGVKIRQPSEMSPYLNMLQADAFANYRQILEDLTLNPAMGHYLDMVNNDAPVAGSAISPNENYAREILQLFSIGVNQLNPDGTLVLDATGNPVPTYVQDTIEDMAHVFTGWTYAPLPGAPLLRHDPANFLAPMVLYRNGAGVDTNHDKGEKLLLSYAGSVDSILPANQGGTVDLSEALDNIFHHPNVGPFVGKQLIQHLVTSNPSPAYVARVAGVFDDDGAGVRGDMGAVVHAILMDPEARGSLKTDSGYGHLREPVLFITATPARVKRGDERGAGGSGERHGPEPLRLSQRLQLLPARVSRSRDDGPGARVRDPVFLVRRGTAELRERPHLQRGPEQRRRHHDRPDAAPAVRGQPHGPRRPAERAAPARHDVGRDDGRRDGRRRGRPAEQPDAACRSGRLPRRGFFAVPGPALKEARP